MDLEVEEKQKTLFDTSGREFNPYWVDEKQKFFVANNPLHWKGHKLQLLIARLEIQSAKNPAQFNSKNYIDAVNELERVMVLINSNGGATDDVLDTPGMAENRDSDSASEVGDRTPVGLGAGVSADNPLAR